MPPIYVTGVFYKRTIIRKEADLVRFKYTLSSRAPEKNYCLSLMSKLHRTLKKIAHNVLQRTSLTKHIHLFLGLKSQTSLKLQQQNS